VAFSGHIQLGVSEQCSHTCRQEAEGEALSDGQVVPFEARGGPQRLNGEVEPRDAAPLQQDGSVPRRHQRLTGNYIGPRSSVDGAVCHCGVAAGVVYDEGCA